MKARQLFEARDMAERLQKAQKVETLIPGFKIAIRARTLILHVQSKRKDMKKNTGVEYERQNLLVDVLGVQVRDLELGVVEAQVSLDSTTKKFDTDIFSFGTMEGISNLLGSFQLHFSKKHNKSCCVCVWHVSASDSDLVKESSRKKPSASRKASHALSGQ